MKALTSTNYEEMIKEKLVLVDFWADWCGPCRMLAPTYEAIAKEFEGRAEFLKCNVDEENNLTRKFGIVSIPTILVLKNREVVDRMSGVVSLEMLRDFVLKQI